MLNIRSDRRRIPKSKDDEAMTKIDSIGLALVQGGANGQCGVECLNRGDKPEVQRKFREARNELPRYTGAAIAYAKEHQAFGF
jgi:hypothetical protein